MKNRKKSGKQPAIPYEPILLEKLKDQEYAAGYLGAAINGDGDPEEEYQIFLLALGNIVKAHGYQNVARMVDVPRDTLYKCFSGEGNPAFKLLLRVMQALELEFAIHTRHEPATKRAR